MKEIRFQLLRRLPGSNKIAVAGYQQWRKLKIEDNKGREFHIVLDRTHLNVPEDTLICNHKGENLFWKDFDPEALPQLPHYSPVYEKFPSLPDGWQKDGETFAAFGIDVEGVPTFSHWDANTIASTSEDMSAWEPLTARTVRRWFERMLYRMENCKYRFEKA